MKGHAVANPIKVGRVFVLRRSRNVPPCVASAVDGTWVELLTSTGEHRRIELALLGRALTLPGYSATTIDLGGEIATEVPSAMRSWAKSSGHETAARSFGLPITTAATP